MRQRWLMQGALCLVLAGALGVAALVSRRAGGMRIELGEKEETIDGLVMFRPKGWSLQRDEHGLVMEEARAGSVPARRLRVRHARSAVFTSPLEYLVRQGEIAEGEARAMINASSDVKLISIGGWPGLMISQTRTSGAEMWKRMLATAVMDGDVILLRLEGQGAASDVDEELLRRFAQKLKLAERGEVKRGGVIQLGGGGIHLRAQPRVSHALEVDPLRVARRLVYSDLRGWIGVDLTPCIARPAEVGQDLAAMMMLRDPNFRPQQARKLDEQTWVCERDASSIFPGMAVLRVAPDGRGVLAEFRWDSVGQAAHNTMDGVNSIRRSVLEQLRFGAASDLPALADRGTSARKALPADPHELFDWDNPVESWQWLDEISSRTSILTLNHGNDPNTVFASGANTVRGEYFSWRLGRNWAGYEFEMRRTGSEISKSTMIDPPANFVPGGLLPMVLGQLPLEPMILSTDWMPGMAGAATRPMLLRLEPAFDMPRVLPGNEDAMRCWSVQVNGQGETSRWYLDEKGRVVEVVFAGKVVLQRKE